MSLKKYLEENRVYQIEDDQGFVDVEYDAIQTYCENIGYAISKDDLETIKSRGLEESFINWKEIYIKDLWEEFGEVPMNPETEEIEESWKHFLPGTHREDIWYWFEEQFDISVAELMGQ